jgi:DNA-binding NarL/FixJ family response regulator
LADDHTLILEGMVRLLENDFEVISTVSDGRLLVEEVDRLRPDAVVIDLGLPLLNGIEAARQIRVLAPEVKILFLTQQSGRSYVQAAFQLGASAYILKSAAASELLQALRQVMAGGYYVSTQLRQRDWSFTAQENPGEFFAATLTPRQREVLQLVAEGKSGKEIAHFLNISVKTVEFHKAGLMEQLGLRSTAELTRFAIEQGIIQN